VCWRVAGERIVGKAPWVVTSTSAFPGLLGKARPEYQQESRRPPTCRCEGSFRLFLLAANFKAGAC